MNAPRIPPPRPPVSDAAGIGHSVIARARLILWLGQALRAYGPFLVTLKLVVATALFGLFGWFGALWHVGLFLLCAGLLIASLIWSRARRQPVDELAARRAVEKSTALANRPLTALADRPVIAPGLWQAHLERVKTQLRQVRLQTPRLELATLDARPVRLGALAILLLALLLGWDEAPRRLSEAAHPPFAQLLPQSKLDAFITPPDYTGQPPLALRAEMAEVTVPEASTLQLRVSGGWFPPVAGLGEQTYRLPQESAGSYLLSLPITTAGPLFIRQDGRVLGRWNIRLLTDTPPQITFARPPSTTAEQALRIDFTAIDDLGLARLEAVIEPGTLAADSQNTAPLILELPVKKPAPEEAHGFRFFDLTAHPWAGNDVIITLRAIDVKGQSSESEPATLKLPERVFTNALAKAIVKLRRELVVRGMSARQDVMNALNQLAGEAEDDYPGDWVGPLSLRTMVARLRYNDSADIVSGLVQQMWETALHFEDGGHDQSLAELRIIQQQLEDALARGADDAEIAQLMNQLEQAMNAYLKQLEQQMQQNPPQGEQQLGQTLSREDLKNFLDQMRQMAQSGQREQAQQMLNQLQQLMENLRSGSMGNPQDDAALQALQDIIRQQQGLMDRTQKNQTPRPMQQMPQEGDSGQSEGGTGAQMLPGSKPGGSATPQDNKDGLPSAQEQGSLKDQLGQWLGEMKQRGLDNPEFGLGQESMGQAEESLGKADAGQALRQQGQALNHLQQGMRELAQQMLQQQRQQQRGDTDPFGRQRGSTGADNSDIEVPDAQEADRARKVLEELRDRAGDMRRSNEERGYLERLLKWF